MANKAPNTDVTKPLVLAGGAALIVVVMLFMEHDTAVNGIGTLGCFVIVAMFGGPLSAIQHVIKQQSTESLPFPMAVATTANCVLWFLYGLVAGDVFVYGPNVLGLCSGLLQLALFATYGFSKKRAVVV